MRLIFEFLISLYPAGFRDRVGDSMRQTLSDSYSEMTLFRKLSLIGELGFGVVYENLRSTEEKAMSRSILTPVVSATLGMLMIAPGIAMLMLLMLSIEPPLGPLRRYVETPPDTPNVVGSLIALTVIVFLPLAGFILNFSVLRRSESTGSGYRANLIIAALGICLVAAFAAAIAIDQYPCWVGVPNCD